MVYSSCVTPKLSLASRSVAVGRLGYLLLCEYLDWFAFKSLFVSVFSRVNVFLLESMLNVTTLTAFCENTTKIEFMAWWH